MLGVSTLEHRDYMEIAIELAQKGAGKVSPNPMVGAVIVKDGKVIGKGYHEYYGGLHAERNALANCTESPVGADMYVTLEPCCHHGKTPPCTEAIISSKIKQVFVGTLDPNKLVAGQGIEILEKNGIEVITSILEEQCIEINKVFFHFIEHKTPYVVMKYAMTLDGKIADINGDSKWITGELARENVHKDRHRYSGIMVGVNTVIKDDPMLDCRIDGGIDPVRIVCDTNLRTPIESKIVQTAINIKTIIATVCDDENKISNYKEKGVEILTVKPKNNVVDLCELMEELGKRNIDSILLEGGGSLNFSALESGVVSKIQTYIAPKIFGGEGSKAPVLGSGFKINECVELENQKIMNIGEDILIESEVKRNVYRNS